MEGSSEHGSETSGSMNCTLFAIYAREGGVCYIDICDN
jgi:hypothetical protein